MNKLTIGIISALALAGTMPAKAQFKLVNPVPQNIQSTGFAQLPQYVNIKTSNNRDNSFAVAALKALGWNLMQSTQSHSASKATSVSRHTPSICLKRQKATGSA